MTDETQAQQAAAAEQQEQFSIQKIYVKDLSFETPNTPQVFLERGEPQMDMEMSNKAAQVAQDIYESLLLITITVKVNEKVAFLVELQMAGIFAISGFTPQRLDYMLNGYCLGILFPYAREVVSDIVSRGGFQQLVLTPVNFDVLYAQRIQQLREQQEAAAGAGEVTQTPAA